jgi:hypothetical protein
MSHSHIRYHNPEAPTHRLPLRQIGQANQLLSLAAMQSLYWIEMKSVIPSDRIYADPKMSSNSAWMRVDIQKDLPKNV